MKIHRLYLVLILLSSLIGYLEWGDNQHQFLFQMEVQVITQLFTDFTSVIHPLTLIPLLGQLLLIITLIRRKPGIVLVYFGMGFLAILLLLVTFVGILSAQWKTVLSTLPFILVSILYLIHGRKFAAER